MTTAVLDASAVLTLLYQEPGHQTVADLVEGSRDIDAGVEVLVVRET